MAKGASAKYPRKGQPKKKRKRKAGGKKVPRSGY
jgi:hypothetical protein